LTLDEASDPAATPGSPRRLTIGDTFSQRHNSLNFLRLAMCLTVIVSHGVTLGGFGNEWIFGRTTPALPTLYGFFCLSGFLIAGSATHNRVGRYLWQRFLRIMPAYWACLLVTALVIGALAWSHEPHSASCSIFSCYYLLPHDGPPAYLYHNWLLATNQVNIGPTPLGGPVPYFWNNSVWTLMPEVFCYLILAGLASLKLLRRRGVVVGLAGVLWLLEVAIAWRGPANNPRSGLSGRNHSLPLPPQGVGLGLARLGLPCRVRSGGMAAVLWSRSVPLRPLPSRLHQRDGASTRVSTSLAGHPPSVSVPKSWSAQ